MKKLLSPTEVIRERVNQIIATEASKELGSQVFAVEGVALTEGEKKAVADAREKYEVKATLAAICAYLDRQWLAQNECARLFESIRNEFRTGYSE